MRGAIGTKKVTKWEEWEHAHAEQDARDRNILIGVLVIIAALVLAANVM